MIFIQNRVVEALEIDRLNHVNNVVYLQWINEVASNHWFSVVPENEKNTYYWVVLRHVIDYKQSALLDDNIILKTWVEEFSGVKSIRIVEIYRGNTLLVKAKTVWCLYKSATKKITRVNTKIENWFKED